jgi:hypothetical protein
MTEQNKNLNIDLKKLIPTLCAECQNKVKVALADAFLA